MRRATSIVAITVVSLAAVVATATARLRHSDAGDARAGLDDATIVAIFDAANSADIETGRLAAERGQSSEVREFGAMLARDHEQVRQLGRDLATRLGVTPTPPADDASAKAHARAMATLRATEGAAFDRAFLQHEAAFHKAVIEAVQTTLLPAVTSEELRALVVKVAPAFQAHMLAAQHLERKLEAGSVGAKGAR